MLIKDWNSNEVCGNEVFHFKNSLRPFIYVNNKYYNTEFFVDLNEKVAYTFEELEYEGLEFYTDETEEDLDFLGVEVDGKFEWIGQEESR